VIISHKYRFIFIKTGKTAGTSIETYLSQHCGDDDILTPFGIEEEGHLARNHTGFKNHMPAYKIREIVSDEIWNSYFKFCVERNPWDKSLSHYHFVIKRFGLSLSIDQYLAGGRNSINYPKYTDPSNPNKLIVDRVISYENLSEELGEVFEKLGVPFDGSLGIRAKGNYRTDRRPYKVVLTRNQKKAIAKKYAQEIKLFGYKF